MDKYLGTMLDNRYEILEVIGTGGMAIVYKARCHRLNRLVAIKILKDDLAPDTDFRRRFQTESQAVAMLSSPNIVAVYDVSKSSSEVEYIVMELIEGITLKQYMNRKGQLNWKESLHFATQITKALSHAHSRGIIHRDIKPHNIMILKDGSVKVADFGIARLQSNQASTLTQQALGSVHYISPEQAKGSQVDARSDLYSLGVVMYEMLTNRLPFEGESAVSVAIQHISSIPLGPREINPDIPKGLESITMKAMNPDLEARYQSATELLRDFEEFRKNPNLDFFAAGAVPAAVKKDPEDGGDQEKKDEPQDEEKDKKKKPKDDIKKRKKKAKRLSTWVGVLCVLGVAVLLVVFLWAFFLGDLFSPNRVSVRNFVGEVYEDVVDNDTYLRTYTFADPVYKESDEYEAGEVISQDPAAGKSVEKVDGKVQITLTVSSGEAAGDMPDVTNKDLSSAKIELGKLNLDLKYTEQKISDDTVTEGYIVRTIPGAGETLARGSTVVLLVSSGPEVKMVAMPNLYGMSRTKAETTLETSNLVLGSVSYSYSSAAEGTVISQSISKDTKIPEKTEVDIVISRGAETTTTTPQPTGSPAATEVPSSAAPNTTDSGTEIENE